MIPGKILGLTPTQHKELQITQREYDFRAKSENARSVSGLKRRWKE